ncbi:hypothetical protein CHLNCDRAFT_27387, partial [Chlorella variabilis]
HRSYRICVAHSTAPQVVLRGTSHRFCQQHGRFHLLAAFTGRQRSCAASLTRHRKRR